MAYQQHVRGSQQQDQGDAVGVEGLEGSHKLDAWLSDLAECLMMPQLAASQQAGPSP